jgi:hypothetical protein
MEQIEQLNIPLQIPELEFLLPIGLVDKDESIATGNAVRALRIIEQLIKAAGLQTAIHSRYALLQTFPRFYGSMDDKGETFETIHEHITDYARQYTTALCPEWYIDFISSLSDDEAEVFLKNYVHAHETWGHSEGIGTLIRTMLESCTQSNVPVVVKELEYQERSIPEDLQSRLGVKDKHSVLGNNFVLGKKFHSRPKHFNIEVGPINIRSLEKFQEAGWADEANASKKLYRLVEFAEPFYLHSRIHIILETSGFVLARAALGKDRLGIVEREFDEYVDKLFGVHT